jgi:phosphatidylinositol 4-kinase
MLYTLEEREEVYAYLQKCRLNPSFEPHVLGRNDLEYYVPQLINYLVFHEEMKNVGLYIYI